MITKDLGMVTAYAYAVSKGYTGTEEEFATLMASYASVAQEAVDAALAAAQSAQSAQDAQTAAEGARDTAQTTVSGAIAGIQAEGQTQIGAVQSEGATQVGNVNSAGQTQVGNVNAAGTTQVGNVNTAGSTQVNAVQAKGTEVLNSIPADYTALSEDVTDLKSTLYGDGETQTPTTAYINLMENATGYSNGGETTYNTKYIAVSANQRCTIKIVSTRTGDFRFGFSTETPANNSPAIYLGKISLTGVASGSFEYIPSEDGYLSLSYWYDLISQLTINKCEGGIYKAAQQVPTISEDVIELQNEVKSITGFVNIDPSDFEVGNIWFKPTATMVSEWVYENSTKRVRTKQGVLYSFPANTKIELAQGSDAIAYIGCFSNGATTTVQLGVGATLTTVSGQYAFVLKDNPEATITDIATLLNRLKITLPTKEKNVGMLNPLLRPARPNLIAHRGDDSLAPENSVPAFVFAGKAKAWGIETDVWETSDGYFVCMHDGTVDRTTDGTGNVKDKTLAEIEALNIDTGAHIDDYPDLKVPELGDYLKVCKRYGAVAIVEIKRVVNYSNLIAEIEKYGMVGSTFFIVQNEAAAVAVRVLSDIPILLLIDYNGDISNAVGIAAKYHDVGLTVNGTLCTAINVQTAHNANVPFVTWTRTTASAAISDFDNGADAVTVNGITSISLDD